MNKARLVVAPATTAYKHSLKEVFSAPGIVGQIKASRAFMSGAHWRRKEMQTMQKACTQHHFRFAFAP